MLTKEQLWQALIYATGLFTLALILFLSYKYGVEVLLIIIPFGVLVLLINTVLKKTIKSSKEQVKQTERHITELNHYIDEQKRTGEILKMSEEKFRNAFDYAAVGMALVATDGEVLKVNQCLNKVFGFDEDDLVTSDFFSYVFSEDHNIFKQNLALVLEGKAQFRKMELRLIDNKQRTHWVICNISIVHDKLSDSSHYIFQIQDVTDRKRAEQQIEYDALHDALTKLPNRVLFSDRLDSAFKRAKRHIHNNFAVIYLDFDRFKLVNDNYGHLVGDEILVEIANRLTKNLRTSDTIARLGGDEFCMLVEEINNIEEVTTVANRLQNLLSAPFIVDGHEFILTVSVGLAGWSNDYFEPELLLRDANTALFHAKKQVEIVVKSSQNKCTKMLKTFCRWKMTFAKHLKMMSSFYNINRF